MRDTALHHWIHFSDARKISKPTANPPFRSWLFCLNPWPALAFQAFYNYHVLELLQTLVRGGISSQMEQHLDKDKFYGLTDSCSTLFSGRRRCKLGLLSLSQTMLLDIEVSLLSAEFPALLPYISEFLKMVQAICVPRWPVAQK